MTNRNIGNGIIHKPDVGDAIYAEVDKVREEQGFARWEYAVKFLVEHYRFYTSIK